MFKRKTNFTGGRGSYSSSIGSKSSKRRKSRRRSSYSEKRRRRSSYHSKKACLKKELRAMEKNRGKRIGKTKVRIKNVDHSNVAIQIFHKNSVFWTVLEKMHLIDLNLPVESKLFIFDVVKKYNYKLIFDAVVIDHNDLCRKGNYPHFINIDNDKDEFIDAITGKKYKSPTFLNIVLQKKRAAPKQNPKPKIRID